MTETVTTSQDRAGHLEDDAVSSPGPSRYKSVSIALHWLMFALLIGVYLAAELQEGDDDGAFAAWHYSLGLSVFVLVWIRIVARLIWPAPAAVEGGWRYRANGGCAR